MSSSDSSSSNIDYVALAAVTTVAEDKFRITWKFEKCSATKNQTSPTFDLPLKDGDDSMKFYIKKNAIKGILRNRGVFVYFQFVGVEKHFTVDHQISLIDATGNRRFTNDGIATHNTMTGGMLYIDRNYLFDSASGLLNDDALEIYCEINIVNGQIMDSPTNNHQQQAATSKVLQDYDSLLESAKFSDVVLVVGKGRAKKELNAHKNILSTRSPVFDAMFAHKDTKEAKENRVLITDVSVDVFEQFIRFVYTGKVTDLDKYAADLLVVADKYQIDSLKSLCSHYLSSELTTESVASFLVLADRHNVSELKSKCIDYIIEHASEVMATKDWSLIKDNNELVVELFQSQSKKFKK